jgi:hypothetical protein
MQTGLRKLGIHVGIEISHRVIPTCVGSTGRGRAGHVGIEQDRRRRNDVCEQMRTRWHGHEVAFNMSATLDSESKSVPIVLAGCIHQGFELAVLCLALVSKRDDVNHDVVLSQLLPKLDKSF